jgi:hypothetical protein
MNTKKHTGRSHHLLHGKCVGGPYHGYVVKNPTMKPVTVGRQLLGGYQEYKAVMYRSEREFCILYVHPSIADDDEEIWGRANGYIV